MMTFSIFMLMSNANSESVPLSIRTLFLLRQ